jgi:ribosomal protein S18 acetylase RimI-like enzyme
MTSQFEYDNRVRIETFGAAHLQEVVAIHLQAFADFKNVRLGRAYAEAFLEWFYKAPDGVALSARVSANAAGYVVGAPIGYQTRLYRRLAPVVICSLVTRPMLLADRAIVSALWSGLWALGGRTARVTTLRELPSPTYALVGIGVTRAVRGRRVGEALLRAFEVEVRRRGGRSMQLSVLRENQAACRLYSRCGWALHSQSTASMLRYSKVLE